MFRFLKEKNQLQSTIGSQSRCEKPMPRKRPIPFHPILPGYLAPPPLNQHKPMNHLHPVKLKELDPPHQVQSDTCSFRLR